MTQDGMLSGNGHYHAINIQVMLLASLVVGVLDSLFDGIFNEDSRLQEDASTGIVFTSLFALGIVLVNSINTQRSCGEQRLLWAMWMLCSWMI